jgi:hypothetical protein
MKQQPVAAPPHLASQAVEGEWVAFPGGELEGKRPKALCPACRAALTCERANPEHVPGGSRPRPLCFQCYRAELDRDRAVHAAGRLDTASNARFQAQLPFEPINLGRLEMLKVERTAARAASVHGIGEYVNQRRQAQIAARHALQAIAAGLRGRKVPPAVEASVLAAAAHAAELQLPESWLPFVVAR